MTTIYEDEKYYRFNPFAKNWVATSGIMNHCEKSQCFWVLDAIASYVPTLAKCKGVDYFLIVSVEVNQNKTALFTIKQEQHDEREGCHYKVIIQQEIEYTDLKENLTFWAINESSGVYDPACQTVVLLPEEY